MGASSIGGTAGAPTAGTGAPRGPTPAAVDPSRVVTEELTGISPPPRGGGLAVRSTSPAWPVRLLAYGITVFTLVTLTFFLPRAMPGDPLDSLLDPASPSFLQDPTLRAEQAAYYGLDQPLVVQYGRYLRDLGRGELGVSIRYTMPVRDLVRERLPWTLLLIGTAMTVAVVVGVAAGVHAGWHRDRPVDRGLLLLFMGFRSFPVFFLASLAAFVLAARLRWFPLSGVSTPFATFGLVRSVVDVAHHLALPMALLAMEFAAGHYLLTRAGMVSQLGADHLLMGRAKGVADRQLKYRYAARNALLPVVTLTAVQLGSAVTGAIFVETVFGYRGIGLLLVEGVQSRDYPTLQACFLVISLIVVTVNLATDLLYRRIDPRTTT